MGTIFVMPTKAAKTKLAMMAANLQIPFRIPNAVPLQQGRRGLRFRVYPMGRCLGPYLFEEG